MLLFSVASIMKAPSNLGGVYNQVTSDFPEGITVDGTTRISGTGAITATTLTTTSTASLDPVKGYICPNQCERSYQQPPYESPLNDD